MKPWYRQLWPWLVISGPGAVLVAGAITMWLAFSGADGLVAEDYYKQGLAINRQLAREEAARAQGIAARVELSGERIRVQDVMRHAKIDRVTNLAMQVGQAIPRRYLPAHQPAVARAPEKALTISRIRNTTRRSLAIIAAAPASPKKPIYPATSKPTTVWKISSVSRVGTAASQANIG